MTPEQNNFFRAVKNGDLAKIKEQLAADPTLVDVKNDVESTALHYAAWKGQADAARLLLDAGADVNSVNKDTHWGTTPLHAAAHGNQKAVAQVLLEFGADLKAVNMHGRTPLAETTVHNALSVAKLLKSHGAQ